jgi:hypothetical protein
MLQQLWKLCNQLPHNSPLRSSFRGTHLASPMSFFSQEFAGRQEQNGSVNEWEG